MKVGDYVRTIYGIKRITDIICGQDIRFDNTDGFDEDLLNYHDYDGISKNSHTWEEIVIGEPKEKIIELIEVGDYVNDSRVLLVKKDKERDTWTIVLDNSKVLIGEHINSVRPIEKIVTKEQFNSMEYKLNNMEVNK